MIIFDVEASGLSSESYPIEIAWQDSENQNCFDSFLIKPSSEWTHWDIFAESDIHHISREMLKFDGISVEEACNRLNTNLLGKTIYSDSIDYDQLWVKKLFESAGISQQFYCESIYHVTGNQPLQWDESMIEREVVKHRALDDARQIIRLLFQVK